MVSLGEYSRGLRVCCPLEAGAITSYCFVSLRVVVGIQHQLDRNTTIRNWSHDSIEYALLFITSYCWAIWIHPFSFPHLALFRFYSCLTPIRQLPDRHDPIRISFHDHLEYVFLGRLLHSTIEFHASRALLYPKMIWNCTTMTWQENLRVLTLWTIVIFPAIHGPTRTPLVALFECTSSR